MRSLIPLTFLAFTFALCTSLASDLEVAKFVTLLGQKKVPIPSANAPKTRADLEDKVLTIHFVWATWCELCELTYASLVELQSEPAMRGKLKILGYSVDEEMNSKVAQKAKAMGSMPQFFVPLQKKEIPPALLRLPILIIEDSLKKGDLDIYSGFTQERFSYMKKSLVRRMQSSVAGDSNED